MYVRLRDIFDGKGCCGGLSCWYCYQDTLRLEREIMSTTEVYGKDLEEAKAKAKPALRVITGGKGTPEGPKNNWLQDFDAGQWFLYHDKTEPVDALVAMVKFKWKTSTIIYSHQFGNRIVRNVPFCERNVLLEVLDKEDLDGKGTEVRSSDVEDDENAAG